MYTTEQYQKAKAALDDPSMEAKVGPERMGKWAQSVAEYESAQTAPQTVRGGLSAEDERRLTSGTAAPLPNDNIAPADQYQGPVTDSNLPNASKLTKYASPPEYVSTKGALATIAENASRKPLDRPPSTQHFEPSEQQFQADMGPYLEAKGLVPGSDEYARQYDRYKDVKWEIAYAQAKAEDRTLTRNEFVGMHGDGWDKLSSFMADKADTAEAFARGLVKGRTLGLAGAMDTNADREQANRHPIATVLGEFKGAASPNSLPSKLTAGAGRLAGVARLGEYGRAAIGGTVGAVADAGGHIAGDYLSDKLHGRQPDEHAQPLLKRLGAAALVGGLGGTIGHSMAGMADDFNVYNRSGSSIGREIANAETAGTTTDVVRGLKPAPSVEEAIEKARSDPHGTAVEHATAKVRSPLVAQQEKDLSGTINRIHAEKTSTYERDPGLKKAHGMHETGKELLNTAFDRAQPGQEGFIPFDDLALEKSEPIREAIRRLYKPRLVADVDAAKEAARTGGHVVSLDEATKAGFKIKGLEAELNPETGIPHNAPSLGDGYANVSEADLLTDVPAANATRAAAEDLGATRPEIDTSELSMSDIEKQLKEAYFNTTGGAHKERVLLKDLRPKVGVQQGDFDQTLLDMQRRGKVVLMGLDNPAELTPEVSDAALHIMGRPRHLVYFQEPQSAPELPPLIRNASGIDIGPPEAPPQGVFTGNASHDLELQPGAPKKAYRVVLEPKPYDAMTTERQLDAIDRAGKAGKQAEPDPLFRRLMAAGRADRRKNFGDSWADMIEGHGDSLKALEQRGVHTGITERAGKYDDLTGNAQIKVNSNVTNYGMAPMETNVHLAELGDAAGVRPDLESVKGIRAYLALKERASPAASMGTTGGGNYLRLGGLLPAAQLRLDAIAKGLARGPDGRPLFPSQQSPGLANTPLGRSLLPSSGLLSLGGGAGGIKTGSVYDAETNRTRPGAVSRQEQEQLERMLSQ